MKLHTTLLSLFAASVIFAIVPIVEAGLLIHYPFDDGAAGVATNTAGGNGTIAGNSVYAGSGIVGANALRFDGSGDYIENINLGSRTEYTTSFWYNTPNGQQCCSTGGLLYTNGNWTNDSLHSNLNSGSSRMWSEFHVGNQQNSGTVATALNTWNHIVASFDGGAITYTVNGVQNPAGSLPMSGPTARLDVTRIGAWNTSRYFTGIFDDWSIWDNTLNEAEAVSIYSLANSTLNYDAGDAAVLFDVYNGTTTEAVIGGLTWALVDDGTLAGALGQVIDLGGGDFGLVLNPNGGGLSTVSAAAIPEPSTMAIAAFGLLGMLVWGRRRRHRAA